MVLRKLAQQQSSTTKDTDTDMLQLLDYLTIYPDYGITYCASDMVLAGHSDAAYLNVRKSCIRAGAHIIISEHAPVPPHNSPVLTITQIIKNLMSSAAEAELAGLFTISKEMIPLCQYLIEMVWPQPKTPIKCENPTEVGMANETIIPRKTESMDINFHWLRCRELQQ